MALKVQIEGLADAISKELTVYGKDVMEGVRRQTDKSMNQLVNETKATAPVGHRKRHYRASISSKVLESNDRVYKKLWYVKGSDYRLSHLLNNGHQLRNGGRYSGTQFITKAYESVAKNYEEQIKGVLKNGG